MKTPKLPLGLVLLLCQAAGSLFLGVAAEQCRLRPYSASKNEKGGNGSLTPDSSDQPLPSAGQPTATPGIYPSPSATPTSPPFEYGVDKIRGVNL